MPDNKRNIIDYANPTTKPPSPSPVVEQANQFIGLLLILVLIVSCIGALAVLWIRSR